MHMGVTSDQSVIEASFDRAYYLSRYPDIAQVKCDPVWHYCEHGWREGRNPSAQFDTRFYLEENADVAQAGMNPFVHFLQWGRMEGRKPQRMATAGFRVKSARSAADQSLGWAVELGDPRRLVAHDVLNAIDPGDHTLLVIAVSHDDYGVSVGGVQNILSDECAEFNRRGVDFLHLCPARPARSLGCAATLEEFVFAARFNGQALGRIDARQLEQALKTLAAAGAPPHWVIHHLMGHAPEVIEQLVAAGCAGAPLFWTHDFFAACTSYTLLRNDVTFCHAPPLDSLACRVCVYGGERGTHAARMRHFLEALRPTVVAPSYSALQLWMQATGVTPYRTAVLPPARLLLLQERRPLRGRSLRVAYLGGQAYHKGWDRFRELAESFQLDERFEFFHFGLAPTGVPRFIRQVEVHVSGASRDAMVRAVARHEIDVVVCWSLWPETFNFTVHEAIAAGSFVVVRRQQGNVWPAAQAHAPLASHSIDDDAELERFLRSGELIAAVDMAPRYRGAALPSLGSAELLALERAGEQVVAS